MEDWTPEGAKELHNLLLGLSPPSFYDNESAGTEKRGWACLVLGDVFPGPGFVGGVCPSGPQATLMGLSVVSLLLLLT